MIRSLFSIALLLLAYQQEEVRGFRTPTKRIRTLFSLQQRPFGVTNEAAAPVLGPIATAHQYHPSYSSSATTTNTALFVSLSTDYAAELPSNSNNNNAGSSRFGGGHPRNSTADYDFQSGYTSTNAVQRRTTRRRKSKSKLNLRRDASRGSPTTTLTAPASGAAASTTAASRTTTALSSTATAVATAQPNQKFKVYCDLDGVLVDFEYGIRKLFPDVGRGKTVQDLERSTMWKEVAAADAFFEKLPWTRNGKQLWDAIKHLQPDILTGVPYHQPSRREKYEWCRRELGIEHCSHIDMAGYDDYDHVCVNGNNNNKKPTSTTQQQLDERYNLLVVQ